MLCYEILYGAVKANGWLTLLSLFCICHFLYSYYIDCYKKGFRIDFWHYNVFLFYVIPFHIMYPFAASDLNYFSTGSALLMIQDYVDKAYVLSLLGYICAYLGFYACGRKLFGSIFHKTISVSTSIIENLVNNTVKNNNIMLFLSWLLVTITITGLLYSFQLFGFTLNLRKSFYEENSILKSFFNLWTALYTNIAGFILISYLQNRQKTFLLIYILTSLFAVFSGARSTVILPFLSAFLIYMIGRKTSIKFKNIFIIASVALFLVFALDRLRSDTSNSEALSALYSFFYGNSFSDVRDFAWILAYWDGIYLGGKSYLSAFMSFIPRSLSEFRSTYAIGVYTDIMLGFDPAIHPGLRPGRFGEVYLNFGIVGIIVLAFIGGYVMRFADLKIKWKAAQLPINYISMYSATFLTLFVDQFYITAGFWSFYVLLIILSFSPFLKIFFRSIKHS